MKRTSPYEWGTMYHNGYFRLWHGNKSDTRFVIHYNFCYFPSTITNTSRPDERTEMAVRPGVFCSKINSTITQTVKIRNPRPWVNVWITHYRRCPCYQKVRKQEWETFWWIYSWCVRLWGRPGASEKVISPCTLCCLALGAKQFPTRKTKKSIKLICNH